MQQLKSELMLVPRAYKQGIKSKARALKCCKEKKLLSHLMSGVTFHLLIWVRKSYKASNTFYLTYFLCT